MIIAGIDYGSKLAGTTVIASLENNMVQLLQSAKKQDADVFVLQHCQALSIEKVFLDAPLSLPGIYRQMTGCDDYFYRQGDKLLHAMSPMFIGGLTARAMKLTHALTAQGVEVKEIYPAHLAKLLSLTTLNYKKQTEAIPTLMAQLEKLLPFALSALPTNWHQVDAILALYSGWRYLNNKCEIFGDAAEGQIFV